MPPIRLDDFLPYRLAVLSDRSATAISRIYEDRHGLSTPQWRVMAAVADKPGRTAQDVVRMTPMEKAMVSRAVSALIGRGLMRREADHRDGRSSRLFLTAEGDAVYSDIAPGALQVEAQMLRRLSEAERRTLLKLLANMQDQLTGEEASVA
jgi:DNA-binding MarR family transcriptional regulator